MLLQRSLLKKIIQLVKSFSKSVTVVTNLSVYDEEILEDPSIWLAVSWDYDFRPRWRETLDTLKHWTEKTRREASLLLTAPGLFQKREEVTEILNSAGFEFKVCPKIYYQGPGDLDQPDFLKFQKLVLWLRANLRDGLQLDISRTDQSVKHLFIDPWCRAVTLTHAGGVQRFTQDLTEKTPLQCLKCPWLGSCLREHDYIQHNGRCCGQRSLLQKLQKLQKSKLRSWRSRRQLFYLTHELKDLIQQSKVKKSQRTVQLAREFFKSGSELVYPAKSYYVAIIYAWLLSQWFGQDFFKALDYEDLLPDDVFFKRLSQDRETYMEILSGLDIASSQIQKTKKFFLEQFLISFE